MEGRSAVVVGGGIGGLTAAVALRRVGWRVTVLEQAERFGEIGAGIALMSNGLRCLDAIGLGDTVRGSGRPQLSTGVRTAAGRGCRASMGTAPRWNPNGQHRDRATPRGTAPDPVRRATR
jgi:2-polyprenyl-6-methoxyphenol hydroxylase-like FAD-dependent oxidoreductase